MTKPQEQALVEFVVLHVWPGVKGKRIMRILEAYNKGCEHCERAIRGGTKA